MTEPLALAFDSAGNLYAANGYNTIYKFTSSGGVLNNVGTVFATSSSELSLNWPSGLAFQPVPEPSTWAMVAMGIGVVLGGLRLRRR